MSVSRFLRFPSHDQSVVMSNRMQTTIKTVVRHQRGARVKGSEFTSSVLFVLGEKFNIICISLGKPNLIEQVSLKFTTVLVSVL